MTRIPAVRRLLMDAKALIAKPESWIQGKVEYYSSKVHQFCAYGAVLHVVRLDGPALSCAVDILDEQTNGNVIDFNDAPTTTHPMVMLLFNKAIRRAKEQGI